MRKSLKKLIKKSLHRRGVQLVKYPFEASLRRRMVIMNKMNIQTVFDVGANIGQYAEYLRELGYEKRIISFEPLKSAFEELKKVSKKDDQWMVCNYALGDEETTSTINVSENSFSSSILEMLPSHLESAPDSKFIAQEVIEIKKLDNIFDSMCKDPEGVMLKIDTQGFEKNVLDGAASSLNKICLIQMEMSLVPLYDKEMIYTDMIKYMDEIGFQLISLEDGFTDEKSGQQLQVDGIFVNKLLLKKNHMHPSRTVDSVYQTEKAASN